MRTVDRLFDNKIKSVSVLGLVWWIKGIRQWICLGKSWELGWSSWGSLELPAMPGPTGPIQPSEDWHTERALVQKENICIFFSLTDLSSSALALFRGFEVIPGGVFHRLDISGIKKEHSMWVEKNKDRAGLFYPQSPGGNLWAVYGSRRNHSLPIQQRDLSKTLCGCDDFRGIRRDPRTNRKPGKYSTHKELIPRDMLACLPSLS